MIVFQGNPDNDMSKLALVWKPHFCLAMVEARAECMIKVLCWWTMLSLNYAVICVFLPSFPCVSYMYTSALTVPMIYIEKLQVFPHLTYNSTFGGGKA